MTKLVEWTFVMSCVLGIWSSIVTKTLHIPMLDDWLYLILPLPLILLFLIGIYSVTVVLYGVFTFNDCPEAAKELQKQIEEAKAELRLKGFIFKEDQYNAIK
uniref:Dolichol-phosphate mannosyltransferase subunit 3 n=1 Tax=Xenopsylla cheopis TaxID=163159 RepID=A0A6M2DY65_XENCH